MMANGSYLDRPTGAGFASFLSHRGIECFVLDLRGHGASVPPSPRSSDWSFDAYVERDLPAAVAAVSEMARIHPGEISCLGHSLGGLAGAAAIGTGTVPPPHRLVLVATNTWHASGLDLWRRGLVGTIGIATSLLGYMPARAIRLGSDDEPAGYMGQFRAWFRSGRWVSPSGIDYGAALRTITTPALVVSADADALCQPLDARLFAERLGGTVSYRCVGRLRGDSVEVDHFGLLRHPALARSLWGEIAAFLG